MSICTSIPISTLFGTSTIHSTSVHTSFSTVTTILPNVTSTFTRTICSTPVVSPSATISLVPVCIDVLIPVTTVIPGSAVPSIVEVIETITENQLSTFPTATLFATSCTPTSSSSSLQPTPTSTSASTSRSISSVSSLSVSPTAGPVTSTSTTPTITTASSSSRAAQAVDGDSPLVSNTPTTTSTTPFSLSSSNATSSSWFLSTPAPTTVSFDTPMTLSDGSVIITRSYITSTFPAIPIYNSPSAESNSFGTAKKAGLIGGLVGAALVFSLIAGLVLCIMRKRRRGTSGARGKYEGTGAGGMFGPKPRLELDEDEMDDSSGGSREKQTQYQYGLVGSTPHPEFLPYRSDERTAPPLNLATRPTSITLPPPALSPALSLSPSPSPFSSPDPISRTHSASSPVIHPSPTPSVGEFLIPSPFNGPLADQTLRSPSPGLSIPSSPLPQQQIHFLPHTPGHRYSPSTSSSMFSADSQATERGVGLGSSGSGFGLGLETRRHSSRTSISALLPAARLKVTNHAGLDELDERDSMSVLSR